MTKRYDHNAAIDIIEKRTLVPCSKQYPRNGEAGTVLLKDGSILLVYGRFYGAADHSSAQLVSCRLDLKSGELTDIKVIFEYSKALNQMSVSLERLADESIGIVFIRKLTASRSCIMFSRSSDEGVTWSEPVNCSSKFTDWNYWTVNNDRLRQLSGGRLLIPVGLYRKPDFSEGDAKAVPDHDTQLACLYSDDNGKSWQLSNPLRIEDRNILRPHRHDTATYKQEWLINKCWQAPYRVQEPGVEELPDGRVLLYCRTPLGYMYQAFSTDNGLNGSELKPAAGIVSTLSPQSIRRIPGSQCLLCLYNDKSDCAWGDEKWGMRTPLVLAVSADNGKSWNNIAQLEDNSHNYCYGSILFFEDKIMFTEYESENLPDGTRRNLASLKMQIIKIKHI